MLKIRRPLGRLIFNMGIAIPGKTVFLIETAPWSPPCLGCSCHYNDVTMRAMASQITSLTIVYSNVYSGTDKKQTSKLHIAGLCARNSPVTGEFPTQRASNVQKCFHSMTSSCAAPAHHPGCSHCEKYDKSEKKDIYADNGLAPSWWQAIGRNKGGTFRLGVNTLSGLSESSAVLYTYKKYNTMQPDGFG